MEINNHHKQKYPVPTLHRAQGKAERFHLLLYEGKVLIICCTTDVILRHGCYDLIDLTIIFSLSLQELNFCSTIFKHLWSTAYRNLWYVPWDSVNSFVSRIF